MKSRLTISVQNDLKDIMQALEERGHNVITTHEVNKDTSIFVLSNIDEEWEQVRSMEWICFSENNCVLTINASKLRIDEILETVDKIAQRVPIEFVEEKKIKISVEEGLDEIKTILTNHGYDVIPSYKVDHDVAAMVFSGVDEEWETITTYQMRQYGESKYVLMINASNSSPQEILDTITRVCIKKKG